MSQGEMGIMSQEVETSQDLLMYLFGKFGPAENTPARVAVGVFVQEAREFLAKNRPVYASPARGNMQLTLQDQTRVLVAPAMEESPNDMQVTPLSAEQRGNTPAVVADQGALPVTRK
jgi:hypothetical protein